MKSYCHPERRRRASQGDGKRKTADVKKQRKNVKNDFKIFL